MGGINGLSFLDTPSLSTSSSASGRAGPATGYVMPRLTAPVTVSVGGAARAGGLGMLEWAGLGAVGLWLILRRR